MTIVECLECRERISDKASVCPYCECPISTERSSDYVKYVDLPQRTVKQLHQAKTFVERSDPLTQNVSESTIGTGEVSNTQKSEPKSTKPNTKGFPWVTVLLILCISIWGSISVLHFGLAVPTQNDVRMAYISSPYAKALPRDRVEAAYGLIKKFPNKDINKKNFNNAAADWRRDNNITGFHNHLEKDLYEEVREIPYSNFKENYLGYQRLASLNPRNELYMEKMKQYRKLYKDY